MAKVLIEITHSESSGDITYLLQAPERFRQIQNLVNYFQALGAGVRKGAVMVSVGDVQAAGALTFSAAAATNTIVINGVTFTCVASGATGDQFNVGGTDAITAANAAAAINASATAGVASIVSASAASNVVTVTAVEPGLSGNAVSLAATGGISASAAKLAGGTDGTEVTYNFGV